MNNAASFIFHTRASVSSKSFINCSFVIFGSKRRSVGINLSLKYSVSLFCENKQKPFEETRLAKGVKLPFSMEMPEAIDPIGIEVTQTK